MTKESRKEKMTDLESCNKELEEIIEINEKEAEAAKKTNKEGTVQAKVLEEIERRGGNITWGSKN